MVIPCPSLVYQVGTPFNNFYKNIDFVTTQIHKESHDIIKEGFDMEIKASIEHELKGYYSDADIEKYVMNYFNDSGFISDKIKLLPIIASYNMGWNKCPTGIVYDSLSGHAFLVGCRTGMVISFEVLEEKCAKCARAQKLGVNPNAHSCTINHEGSSVSMEAKLALDLTIQLHNEKNCKAYLKNIVSDDDSTMRLLI